MSSPQIIDIESLLKPIAGEQPAGKDVDFVNAELLKELRVENNPDDYAENDPNRPKNLVPPRWQEVVRLCKSQLEQSSKYPTLAAHMTEALARLHGYAGARDGFKLFRRLTEEFMEQLYPNKPLEEPDDIDKFIKGIRWLDDKDKGAQMEKTLSEAPLLRYVNPEERLDLTVSLADLKSPENQSPRVTDNKLSEWLSHVPVEACVNVQSDIKACQEELDKLLIALADKVQVLLQRMNEAAGESQKKTPGELKDITFTKVPGMTRCKEVLAKALEKVSAMIDEKNNAPSASNDASSQAGSGGGGGGGKGGFNVGQTRDQLYEQLRQIAKQLEKIDAHSPVPLLILRAVQLRELSFPKLVELLSRDSKVLQFIAEPESGVPPA